MNDEKRQPPNTRLAMLALFLMTLALPVEAEDWAPAQIAKADPAVALRQLPESATALRRVLGAAHMAHDGARVRAALHALAAMGYSPTQETMNLLSPYLQGDEQVGLARQFAANGAAAGTSRLYASVPAERRLIEGISYDPRTARLFAASVVGRELLVFEHGAWRVVAGIDGGSLFGMAADVPRRRLWIASGSLEQTPNPQTAFRGLIALDLDSLRVVRRVALAGSPGDVAIGSDGAIYASDPVSGTIFRLRPGASAASVLVPSGRFGSPQGLVLSADQRRLYVADYASGIGIVDPASGHVRRLAAHPRAMLDGIDGLVGYRGALIAIQNGVRPHRIVRLRLDRTGDFVVGVDILESANPAWGEPTLGTIAGGQLLYVADGQWERYGAGGAESGAARPTPIRALSVEAGLHGCRRPRDGIANQRQRRPAPGGCGNSRLLVTLLPNRDGFVSHRTNHFDRLLRP